MVGKYVVSILIYIGVYLLSSFSLLLARESAIILKNKQKGGSKQKSGRNGKLVRAENGEKRRDEKREGKKTEEGRTVERAERGKKRLRERRAKEKERQSGHGGERMETRRGA